MRTDNEVELLHSITYSISPAARTQACSPTLLLLLWDVAGLRGWRLEVEGWSDGGIDMQSMRICHPHEKTRAAFLDFPKLRPGKKSMFPCGRSAKTMQNMWVYTQKRFQDDEPWVERSHLQQKAAMVNCVIITWRLQVVHSLEFSHNASSTSLMTPLYTTEVEVARCCHAAESLKSSGSVYNTTCNNCGSVEQVKNQTLAHRYLLRWFSEFGNI